MQEEYSLIRRKLNQLTVAAHVERVLEKEHGENGSMQLEHVSLSPLHLEEMAGARMKSFWEGIHSMNVK